MPSARQDLPFRGWIVLVLVLMGAALPASDSWVLPTSHADLEGKWSDEAKAGDADLGSYATDTSNRVGDGAWLELDFGSPRLTDRLRIAADFGFGIVDAITIEAQVGGTWTAVYQGSVANAQLVQLAIAPVTSQRFRVRFHYLKKGYWFWLYEFQLFELAPTVIAPAVEGLEPGGLTASSAILRGIVTDAGGAPVRARFLYSEAGAGSPTVTPWQEGLGSGDLVTALVRGLYPHRSYSVVMEADNSAGSASTAAVEFVPVYPDIGSERQWLHPTGSNDPDGAWDDEPATLDGHQGTGAHAAHDLGADQWSPFLELTTSYYAYTALRLRAEVLSHVDALDIDLLTDAGWKDLYDGPLDPSGMLQIDMPATVVSSVRLRFHVDQVGVGLVWHLYELELALNRLPSISIDTPADGAAVQAWRSTSIAVSAQDPDPLDMVQAVDLGTSDGQTIALSATADPTVFIGSWLPVAPGSQELRAQGRSSDGTVARSVPVTVDVSPLAGERIGPFRWVRHLLGEQVAPETIAADGTMEDAILLSASVDSGVMGSVQWSGTDQTGARRGGGNTFIGDPDHHYWIGLDTWAIQERAPSSVGWIDYHRVQQDAHLRLGYLALDAADIEAAHGVGPTLSGIMPADALVVELAFRHVQGGGTAWQMGDYNGTPLEVGVWQVPAGLSLQQAQADDVNRLAQLVVLAETTPAAPVLFCLQAGSGGTWSLHLDLDGDGETDRIETGGSSGNRSSSLMDIDGSSGLLVTCEAAGGVHSGNVGRTLVDWQWREIAAPAAAPDYDRRPLHLDLPRAVYSSPALLAGRRWSVDRAVTVEAPHLQEVVLPRFLNDRDFVVHLPLRVDEEDTTVMVSQEGQPPTRQEGLISWLTIDLAQEGEYRVFPGGEVKLTYRGFYHDAERVQLDLYGAGSDLREIAVGDVLRVQYPDPGRYAVTAKVDADGDGDFSDETIAAKADIVVGEVWFPEAPLGEVGFERRLWVFTGSRPAQDVAFSSSDPAILAVRVLEAHDAFAVLGLTPAILGEVSVLAHASDGDLLGSTSFTPFTVEIPTAAGLPRDSETGRRYALMRIRPPVAGLDLRFDMQAGRAAFDGGAKIMTVATDSALTSTGEPGFVLHEPEGAASYLELRHHIDVADESAANMCFRVSGTQDQYLPNAANLPQQAMKNRLINPELCTYDCSLVALADPVMLCPNDSSLITGTLTNTGDCDDCWSLDALLDQATQDAGVMLAFVGPDLTRSICLGPGESYDFAFLVTADPLTKWHDPIQITVRASGNSTCEQMLDLVIPPPSGIVGAPDPDTVCFEAGRQTIELPVTNTSDCRWRFVLEATEAEVRGQDWVLKVADGLDSAWIEPGATEAMEFKVILAGHRAPGDCMPLVGPVPYRLEVRGELVQEGSFTLQVPPPAARIVSQFPTRLIQPGGLSQLRVEVENTGSCSETFLVDAEALGPILGIAGGGRHVLRLEPGQRQVVTVRVRADPNAILPGPVQEQVVLRISELHCQMLLDERSVTYTIDQPGGDAPCVDTASLTVTTPDGCVATATLSADPVDKVLVFAHNGHHQPVGLLASFVHAPLMDPPVYEASVDLACYDCLGSRLAGGTTTPGAGTTPVPLGVVPDCTIIGRASMVGAPLLGACADTQGQELEGIDIVGMHADLDLLNHWMRPDLREGGLPDEEETTGGTAGMLPILIKGQSLDLRVCGSWSLFAVDELYQQFPDHIRQLIDVEASRWRLIYDMSDPAQVEQRIIAGRRIRIPGPGAFRVWRDRTTFKELLRSEAWQSLADLPDLSIEGAHVTQEALPIELEVELVLRDPGEGRQLVCAGPLRLTDSIMVRVKALDLDIDSDNSDGLQLDAEGTPQPFAGIVSSGDDAEDEDLIEALWPGRLVRVNDTDWDLDQIPGSADGFDWSDPFGTVVSEGAGPLAGGPFVPVRITLPCTIDEMLADADAADLPEVVFQYMGSAPGAITLRRPPVLLPDGTPTGIDGFRFDPAGAGWYAEDSLGYFRLWKKDGLEARTVDDYVAPHERIPLSRLFASDELSATFYLECVRANTDSEFWYFHQHALAACLIPPTRPLRSYELGAPLHFQDGGHATHLSEDIAALDWVAISGVDPAGISVSLQQTEVALVPAVELPGLHFYHSLPEEQTRLQQEFFADWRIDWGNAEEPALPRAYALHPDLEDGFRTLTGVGERYEIPEENRITLLGGLVPDDQTVTEARWTVSGPALRSVTSDQRLHRSLFVHRPDMRILVDYAEKVNTEGAGVRFESTSYPDGWGDLAASNRDIAPPPPYGSQSLWGVQALLTVAVANDLTDGTHYHFNNPPEQATGDGGHQYLRASEAVFGEIGDEPGAVFFNDFPMEDNRFPFRGARPGTDVLLVAANVSGAGSKDYPLLEIPIEVDLEALRSPDPRQMEVAVRNGKRHFEYSFYGLHSELEPDPVPGSEAYRVPEYIGAHTYSARVQLALYEQAMYHLGQFVTWWYPDDFGWRTPFGEYIRDIAPVELFEIILRGDNSHVENVFFRLGSPPLDLIRKELANTRDEGDNAGLAIQYGQDYLGQAFLAQMNYIFSMTKGPEQVAEGEVWENNLHHGNGLENLKSLAGNTTVGGYLPWFGHSVRNLFDGFLNEKMEVKPELASKWNIGHPINESIFSHMLDERRQLIWSLLDRMQEKIQAASGMPATSANPYWPFKATRVDAINPVWWIWPDTWQGGEVRAELRREALQLYAGIEGDTIDWVMEQESWYYHLSTFGTYWNFRCDAASGDNRDLNKGINEIGAMVMKSASESYIIVQLLAGREEEAWWEDYREREFAAYLFYHLGEFVFVNDLLRAAGGVDIMGNELSGTERTFAGAMVAVDVLPIFGWLAKGGKWAAQKAAKLATAASDAALHNLQRIGGDLPQSLRTMDDLVDGADTVPDATDAFKAGRAAPDADLKQLGNGGVAGSFDEVLDQALLASGEWYARNADDALRMMYATGRKTESVPVIRTASQATPLGRPGLEGETRSVMSRRTAAGGPRDSAEYVRRQSDPGNPLNRRMVDSCVNGNHSAVSRLRSRSRQCFPAGMQVLMADGALLPIEAIRVGDRVLARHDRYPGAAARSQLVEQVFISTTGSLVATRWVRAGNARGGHAPSSTDDEGPSATDDRALLCTPDHPVRTTQGWQPIGQLAPGALIAGHDGPLCLLSLERIACAEPVTVYNLRVAGDHTYYVLPPVGSVSDAALWVHNDGCQALVDERYSPPLKRSASDAFRKALAGILPEKEAIAEADRLANEVVDALMTNANNPYQRSLLRKLIRAAELLGIPPERLDEVIKFQFGPGARGFPRQQEVIQKVAGAERGSGFAAQHDFPQNLFDPIISTEIAEGFVQGFEFTLKNGTSVRVPGLTFNHNLVGTALPRSAEKAASSPYKTIHRGRHDIYSDAMEQVLARVATSARKSIGGNGGLADYFIHLDRSLASLRENARFGYSLGVELHQRVVERELGPLENFEEIQKKLWGVILGYEL